MDYLPVYDGEQDDDVSVKVSAGKLQKAGVRTEAAELRTLNTMVRAPGTLQQDERRVSVVSLRFERLHRHRRRTSPPARTSARASP